MKRLKAIQSSKQEKMLPNHSGPPSPLPPLNLENLEHLEGLTSIDSSPSPKNFNLLRLSSMTPTSQLVDFSTPLKLYSPKTPSARMAPVKVSKKVHKRTKQMIERDQKYHSRKQALRVEWKLLMSEGSLPESREDPRMVILNNSLYLFGGQSRVKPSCMLRLPLHNCRWTLINNSFGASGRFGHSMVSYKTNLLVFGGASDSSDMSSNLSIFNVSSKTWNTIEGYGRLPAPRRHHSATTVGRHMLIFGGVFPNHKKTNELMMLDLNSYLWTQLESKSMEKLSHSSMTAVLDSIQRENTSVSVLHLLESRCFMFSNSGVYIFGGLDSNNTPTDILYKVTGSGGEIACEEFQTSGTGPCPRYSHTAVSVDHLLFVFGGRNDAKAFARNFHALNDLFVLNVIYARWEEVIVLGNIPRPRWGHCMAASKNKIFLFGGINHKTYHKSEIFCLDLEPDNTKVREEEYFRENSLKKTKRIRIMRSYTQKNLITSDI